MLKAISRKILHLKPGLVRWINFEIIDKYTWRDGDKSYTLQLYDIDKHWEEFLPLFAKGFIHSTVAERYLPNVAKREEFFNLYFQYRYKKSFCNGRSSLYGVKVHDVIQGKQQARLIYGGICLYDTIDREVDATELINFDKEMTENIFKRDQWCDENIYEPMRRVAEKMGTVAWSAAYHVIDPETRNQNIMKKCIARALKICRQYGIQRHEQLNLLPLKVEPDFYSILIETPPISEKYLKLVNFEKVAHLHYNHSMECGCYRDNNVKRNKISCHFIIAPVEMAESIRKFLLELQPEPTVVVSE